jgi:hypothetical protein
MQKRTLKKISILGLVLMTASAVTAILPASKDQSQQLFSVSTAANESEPNDNSTASCAPTLQIDSDDECVDPSATAGPRTGSTSAILDPTSNQTTF